MAGAPHPHMGLQTVSWLVQGTVPHGAQLWVALPESARHGEHSFVLHEPAPIRDTPGLRARVFVGRMGSTVAQGVTPLVGVDLSPESPPR